MVFHGSATTPTSGVAVASAKAAATKAEDRAIPPSDGIPEEDVKVLRDKGMNVTVLTKAQEKVMADAMQPAVIKAFIEASPDGARLIEMMRNL